MVPMTTPAKRARVALPYPTVPGVQTIINFAKTRSERMNWKRFDFTDLSNMKIEESGFVKKTVRTLGGLLQQPQNSISSLFCR
jgi:hypothetical protein